MTHFKRIISAILLLAILIGMVPATVQATGTSAATENIGTSIEGTNGFGTLLSEEIQTKQEENEKAAESGYNVIGLTIEDGIATVEYSSLEEAILVVSLYTEDSVKMLLSGKTVVSPEETVATVQLNGDIPQYFMAAAYLLDTYDNAPLCTSYETPMYTKEMQQLLASTTDDYDADKILQLDDDNTTNFAVYTDSTIVLEYEEGVNTVVSANDETLTYVIENADRTVTGLLPGNIFAYAYGEDQILIAKVATVTVDGTTVTINGADVEMEEVFSHLKVEAAGDTANMTVDENSGDEDVTYVGMVEDRPAQRSGEGGSTSGSVSAGFEVEKKSGNKTLTASLLLNINLEFSYYIAKSRQFIEFKATTMTTLSAEVSGKISYPVIKLKTFGFSPIPGVYIGFEPTISFIFSAKVSANLKTTDTIGFSYDSTSKKDKTKDLSTPSKVDFTLDAEGTIFFGVDFAPKLKILDGWVLEASLSAEIGLELKAEMDGTAFGDFAVVGNGDAPESLHNCETCLKVDLSLKIEPAISLKFLKVISAGTKLTVLSWSLGEWYLSENHGWFKKGTCPNQSYRITVSVSDANSKRVTGSAVTVKADGQSTETSFGTTNNTGTVANYLPAGNYTFTAWVAGQPVRKTTKISEPSKVTINKEFIDNGPPTLSGSINPDSITDFGITIASGQCGDTGGNILWSLHSNGVLKLSGKSAMENYSAESSPWYDHRENIKKIIIEPGITTIGDFAFEGSYNLTSIVIPNSVTTIGDCAFHGCDSLNSVTIGNSVTTIGMAAFSDCRNLTSITIPYGVTTIGDSAFLGCYNLVSITIPNSVTTIDSFAFQGCSMTNITIPNSVTTIGYSAFCDCQSLTSVTIGDSVTSIGEDTFYLCSNLTGIWVNPNNPAYSSDDKGVLFNKNKTNLIHVPNGITGAYSIPSSVITISEYAFQNCHIASVTIPNSVTTIGYSAFYQCRNLTSVTIGNGVTTIGDEAFGSCSRLTTVTIPDSVTTIGAYAFVDCRNLTYLTIGNRVATIGDYAFYETNLTDVYYTGTQAQWDAISIGEENDPLLTATMYYNSKSVTKNAALSDFAETPVVQAYNETTTSPSLRSIFSGTYETEVIGSYTLKKATFSGLVPGEQYVLLSLVSIEAEDVLAPENLLYINQAAAAEDGTLIFAYAQRTDTEISYVMACGASNQNLKDAVITFPSMAAKEELQAVHPTVAYNGKTLIEDVDYVISGTVDYTKAGEYTCYIRGIYDYTGLVECVYKVIDATASVTTEENIVYYETIEKALQTCSAGSILDLYKDVKADIVVSQNMLLNLNGFDINGNVTVNSGAKLVAWDSQTDDYTIKDEKGYGKITGTVSGVQAQDGYMMITEDDGVSFHRVNLQLKAMSLRASDAGIYFKSDFAGDELVAENVKQFGVALSLQGIPTTDNLETDCKYSKFTEFQAGVQDEDTTSTLLKGVMKSGNAALVNFRNANMPIYGRAYILTNEGEYIFGAAACRTFKQQVEAIDTMWSKLSASQKTSLAEMYDEFTSVMKSWNLPNLKDYIK